MVKGRIGLFWRIGSQLGDKGDLEIRDFLVFLFFEFVF